MTEYGYDADRNITSQRTVISGMESMGGTLPFMGNPDGFTKPCMLMDNTYTYDSNIEKLEGMDSFDNDRFVDATSGFERSNDMKKFYSTRMTAAVAL